MTAANQPSTPASGIKAGQRVRVVLEGEVRWAGPGYFELGLGAHQNAIRDNAEHVVSVEVLPDPEPEWQHGDVVLDEIGEVFVRLGEDRWRYLYQGASSYVTSIEVDHNVPTRPLTLLVRDAKPVTS